MSFVTFAIVAFLAVVLALEGLYNIWASRSSAEAKRIAARLATLSGEVRETQASIERAVEASRFPRFDALLVRTATGQRLQDFIGASGMKVSLAELIVMSALLLVAGLFLPVLLGQRLLVGAVLGLVLSVLPWWLMTGRRRARIGRIERQFPEALDLMGRAMRAGHSFSSALKMAGEEVADPLGRDFRVLVDEMNYGASANEALTHLARRVPLPDVSYFVVAVKIHRDTGGNLAELLDRIASIVRERLTLLGEIRTLSAEGRLSALILTCLPFGVGLVVNLTNPEFMAVLWTDPVGQGMVVVSLLMMLVGTLWMRAVIRIRV